MDDFFFSPNKNPLSMDVSCHTHSPSPQLAADVPVLVHCRLAEAHKNTTPTA